MPVLAMMIAPASRRFFVSVASYGTIRFSNASAPPVVRMSVVWTLSFGAIGMPCSGPRIRRNRRSRSRSSAISIAFGFTVIAAWSRSSYVAIRIRYCRTISTDVTRPCSRAARISGIVASTTENGLTCGFAAGGACAERTRAVAADATARTTITCFMSRDYMRRTLRMMEFSMSLDPAMLFLSLVAGGIGFVLFVYGKKQARWPQLVAGLGLMVYPYFTPTLGSMIGVGLLIVAGLWLAVRQGW